MDPSRLRPLPTTGEPMTDLSQLDDATSQRILTTIARARSSNPPDDSPNLRTALAHEFEIVPSHTTVSPGDLAREALILLAEDPATRIAIESMANEPPTARQTYDGGATIALGLAVVGLAGGGWF